MGYAVVSKTTARKGLRVRIPPPALRSADGSRSYHLRFSRTCEDV